MDNGSQSSHDSDMSEDDNLRKHSHPKAHVTDAHSDRSDDFDSDSESGEDTNNEETPIESSLAEVVRKASKTKDELPIVTALLMVMRMRICLQIPKMTAKLLKRCNGRRTCYHWKHT